MELRQLKYFLKTKELLSFTAAAKQLHISQSTLSQQIRQLETEIGIPLFNRIGKRISLTEAAEVFAVYAEKSVTRAGEGLLALQDMQELRRGNLRIGVSYGLRATLIAVLKSFARKYPHIKIQVSFGMTDLILSKLQDSVFDFVLCFREDHPDSHLDYRSLFTSEMTLVTADNSSLADREYLKFKDILKLPLILPPEGYSTSSFIRDKLLQAGWNSELSMEINDIPTLLEMIRTGHWHTLLTTSTAQNEHHLCCIPIREKAMTRTAVLASQKEVYITAVMRAFLKELIP